MTDRFIWPPPLRSAVEELKAMRALVQKNEARKTPGVRHLAERRNAYESAGAWLMRAGRIDMLIAALERADEILASETAMPAGPAPDDLCEDGVKLTGDPCPKCGATTDDACPAAALRARQP